MTEIQTKLFDHRDIKYKEFNSTLIPNIDKNLIIGVRVPDITRIAKELKGENKAEAFLCDLPHKYFEENMLHGKLVAFDGDFDKYILRLDMFLPHVDNWAVCDSIHVINDKPRKQKLKEKALEWINAEHDFTIRFGVLVLMKRFLDEDFSVELMQKICRIKSEGYYVKMMKAWYIASALDKQYEYAYEALNSWWLDDWVHNKAIQKASESRLVNTPTKNILKAMKK